MNGDVEGEGLGAVAVRANNASGLIRFRATDPIDQGGGKRRGEAWAAPNWVHQTAQRINARRITVIISKLTTAIMEV